MSVRLQIVRSGILTFVSAVLLLLPEAAVAQMQFETVKALAGDGSEGVNPAGPLAQTADGWIYGLTGPPSGDVALVRFHPDDPAGTFTSLGMSAGSHGNRDGGNGGLVRAGDGNLYFVNQSSNCGGYGRLLRLTPPSTLTVVKDFCYVPGEPSQINYPAYGVTVGPDGALYGTMHIGGAHTTGGVYRVGLDGAYSVVADFPATFPYGTAASLDQMLVAGSDGRLYGTLVPSASPGLLYRVDPATGVVEVLHEFGLVANGRYPRGRLLEVPPLPGHDIAFVGVAEQGGTFAVYGTVYRIDVAGSTATVAKLHDFTDAGSVGWQPRAGLVRGPDGQLYGTTWAGTSASVYRLGSEGGFSVVHALGLTPGGALVNSWAPLLLASDGHLYGTTYINSGGPPPADAAGSIFRLTRQPQVPLTVTGAPENATFGTSFVVGTTGGSGTGAVSFSAEGACGNASGGALVTMTSGTGLCSIVATKDGDADFSPATSAAVFVSALKAAQTPLVIVGAPVSAAYGASFTVDVTGGSGSGILSLSASGACGSVGGGLITMTSGTGICVLTAVKEADANYEAATTAGLVNATKSTQAALTVTGAPASAPNGSAFTVGTAGGNGTGVVSFSVSGACTNISGGVLVTMTDSTGTCSITGTKAGDANFDPVSSAAVLVLATPPPQLQFETVKALAGDGSEGVNPAGPLAQTADGWIYGLTGPPSGDVALVRFHPDDPAGTFTSLGMSAGSHGNRDGGNGGLVRAGDGNLYFVNQSSNCGGYGRLLRLTPPSTLTVVKDFCYVPGELNYPAYGVTVGPDGALYGTMHIGGAHTTGGVYRVGLDGAYSVVADFPATFPYGTAASLDQMLVAGSDGRLYGTLVPSASPGLLYRVDPATGVVEVLHEFGLVANGRYPRGRLLEVPPLPGHDIAFVGVAEQGGTFAVYGTVYRIDVAGSTATVAKLHDFTDAGSVGWQPRAGLVRGPDGQLYGTTWAGTSASVYRLGSEGGFSVVHALGLTPGGALVNSWAPLLLASDGHLYGTTYINSGGPPPADAAGSVFRIRFVTSHDLQVSIAGSGAGTVTSGGGHIACPGDCAETYATGTATTLTAVAGVGSTFVGWSGDCTGTAPCVLAMNAATNVTATFALSGRDLWVTAVSNPPALAAPGGTYGVTDTTANQGALPAGNSTTRFYLSLDAVRGTGDPLLGGSRAVPGLDTGVSSTGGTTLTIPTSVLPGVYWQFACADYGKTVAESNELNNCTVSASQVQILRPDLVESIVDNPPALLAPGTKVTVADTVQNISAVTAAASTTRYYLSVDVVKDGSDVALNGTRSVPSLAAGASAAGSKAVTIPGNTPPGTYHLLACADDAKKITESDEGNNCVASATTILVAVPDLTVTLLTGLPAAVGLGQKLTLTDTVVNQGQGPAGASTTRFYLSVDAVWTPGDVLLTGTRSVVALAPGAVSVGSKLVTVPLATLPGSYYAIACADDKQKVAEGNEGNNCTASATTVTVSP